MGRLRVVTHSPIPIVKVWYQIPELPTAGDTVGNLKNALCRDVPALANAGLIADQLLLEIDGFELLDISSVSVILDGDILNVKRSPNGAKALKHPAKRKHIEEEILVNHSKRRKVITSVNGDGKTITVTPSVSGVPFNPMPTHIPQNMAVESPLSSSASSSSEEESSGSRSGSVSVSESDDISGVKPEDTSEDESSGNSNESEEESESDSESNKPPSEAPVRHNISEIAPSTRDRPSAVASIPPGKGRSSTHARNQRRRKLRALQRTDNQGFSSRQEASVNTNEPTGAPGNGDVSFLPYNTPPPPSLLSPSLADEEGVQGQSTGIINAPASSSEALQAIKSTLTNKNKRKGFKKSMEGTVARRTVFEGSLRKPRLVPPSERDDVPSNMFVTTVDAELRDRSTNAEEWNKSVLDVEQPLVGEGEWETIENRWELFQRLESIDRITPGQMVGWKALALDQGTFTPQVIVHMAQVISVCPSSNSCTIKTLVRPGYTQFGFGGVELQVEGDDEEPELKVDGPTILAAAWKSIRGV